MGHNRLPSLPSNRTWKEVVELLEDDAPSPRLVGQAAEAAKASFLSAADDPIYVETVRILAILARAGTMDAIGPALRHEGLALDSSESLLGLLDAVSTRLDEVERSGGKTSDLGELARRSLLGTLHASLVEQMPGLFTEERGDLAAALRAFSGPTGFSSLARGFFTRMTSETLAYWLERTLGAHVQGPGRRNAFDAALDQYSAEATRIIKEFSAGWFAKNALFSEALPTDKTRAFAAIAFKKINDELKRKSEVDV